MAEELKPSIEIKTRRRDHHHYYIIAFDGIEIDFLMEEYDASVVREFLQHMVDQDWDFLKAYKPEG